MGGNSNIKFQNKKRKSFIIQSLSIRKRKWDFSEKNEKLSPCYNRNTWISSEIQT